MQDQLLYRSKQSQAIDHYLIEHQGYPGYDLMERAAKAAFQCLQRIWPQRRHIAIFCGAGNNGGDGWVLARLAWADDWQVQVYSLCEPDSLHGDALQAAKDYLKLGGQWQLFDADQNPATLATADIIVDALLGTGIKGPPRAGFATAIELINQAQKPVLALDIPSGLDGDTGEAYEPTVTADHTVTFIVNKQGLFTGDAADVTGEVELAPLVDPEHTLKSLPQGLLATGSLARREQVLQYIPKRRPTTHKGQAGHVIIAGGGPGMPGAVLMAGHSALRSGAGMSSLLTHASHAAQLITYCPELMIRGWQEADDFPVQWLNRGNVIALGPGLGQSAWSRAVFEQLITSPNKLVIDADGLNLLADACAARTWPAVSERHWLLTPHPGEAARLLNCTAKEVQQDRINAALTLAERFGSVVILKGAGTVVAAPDRYFVISPGASGAMATAGMGDVLTGLCAALLAQGMPLYEAAQAAVYLHFEAAQLAAKGRSRGVLATDLLAHLPDLFPSNGH